METTCFGMPELVLNAQHTQAAARGLAHHGLCAGPPGSSGSLGRETRIPFLPVGARLIELVDGVRVLLGVADLIVAVLAGVVGLQRERGGGGGSLFWWIIMGVCSVARRAALVPI